MKLRVGIDTGGTFTDLVCFEENSGDIAVAKRPSTPKNPEAGVFDVLTASGIKMEDIEFLILGSTIAINAFHQRKGARVLYLTTQGFEDVLFIQRIHRKFHYDLDWVKPSPFVERRDCIGVRERVTYDEQILVPLEARELERLRDMISRRISENDGDTAIAVNLLFSYASPVHEERLGEFLRQEFPGVPVSLSHQVSPIWREYERGSTTVAEAYVKPMVSSFARHVDNGLRERGLRSPWAFMKSNGGNMLAEAAAEQAVQLVLSGLAGGIVAGRYFGEEIGSNKVITLDMGGTSTDVGLVIDGEYGYTTEYQVEWGLPIAAPFIDVTTIGAGGGSIASIDKGGFLKVGPQSAGADPGPACYDTGGTLPTVTDAQLVLGVINPEYFLGGRMKLNLKKATQVIAEIAKQLNMNVDETAQAIVQLANENMANAIRLITVERGIDPREFDLVAFGGAGPLHAVALAESVGIPRVIVPPNAGLASAFGNLLVDLRVDRSETHAYRTSQLDVKRVDERFTSLTQEAELELRKEGFAGTPVILRSISMRYLGQNYEQDISVPAGQITEKTIDDLCNRFHQQHDAFYGYSISGEVMELIHFNVSVIGERTKVVLPSQQLRSTTVSDTSITRKVFLRGKEYVDCVVRRRKDLTPGVTVLGPAIIEDEDSTVMVPQNGELSISDKGLLLIVTDGGGNQDGN